jgi:Tol biopolymer transport system component
VNVGFSGAQANGSSGSGTSYSISVDGRYVAFSSDASNLVAGDAWVGTDVFVRDRQNGTTELVSVDSSARKGTAIAD